jgi:LCP family protein required for cell wall assembly
MRRPSHRGRPPRTRRIAKRVVVVIGVLAVVITTGLYVLIHQLEGNITSIDVSGDTGKKPKKVVEKAINVLVMGDDTRKGQGPAIGGTTPGLSDTTILLHLSANHKFAYGVSLPRDAIVQRPSCKTGSGTVDPGGLTQFNAAYAIGGPACTIKTIQKLTGVAIDHFVVVRFRGFRQMVDAIGGVKVCLPVSVSDPGSNIYFPEGTYDVDGEQALNYVRERHGLGDGSDLGRMKRQQAFIASMINKVVSAGVIANPIKLIKFLEAATKSLVTDPGFSHLGALASLGRSLEHIGLSHVKFISVPNQPYPSDPNRVEWAPSANKVWYRIIHDEPLSKADRKGSLNAANVAGKNKAKASAAAKAAAAQVGLCA